MSDSSTDSSDDEPSCKRIYNDGDGFGKEPAGYSKGHVWRNMVEENILESAMHQADLESNDRNVESYDYKRFNDQDDDAHSSGSVDNNIDSQDAMHIAAQNNQDFSDLFAGQVDYSQFESNSYFSSKDDVKFTPAQLEIQKNLQSNLRKRKVKSKRAKKMSTRLKCKATDPPEMIVNEICQLLKEPKRHLIAKVVEVIGCKKTIDLFHSTEEVQRNGGMMTNDGSRRRSAGGVFLILLKDDDSVSPEQVDSIFSADGDLKSQRRKIKKAKRKAAKVQDNMSVGEENSCEQTVNQEEVLMELEKKREDLMRQLDTVEEMT